MCRHGFCQSSPGCRTRRGASGQDRPVKLEEPEQIERARRLKLIVFHWVRDAEESQLAPRDRTAVDSLRKAGIRTAIITRESASPMARSAAGFGSAHVFVAFKDRLAQVEMIADDADIPLNAVG